MTDDQEVVIVDGNGTEHIFPAGFDPKRAAAIVSRQGQGAGPNGAGPGLAAMRPIASMLKTGAEEVATNPGIKKGTAAVGEVLGGIEGAMKGGPLGAAGGAYAGGRAGWHSGKLLQRMAAPVATLLERLQPYMQTASTISGAQGALDLAQMAEPTRRDIGFLGIGVNEPRNDAEKQANPALLNLLLSKLVGAK